jgi:Tfp pilus assembly PilM family ATPase
MSFLRNNLCSKIKCAFPTPKYLNFNMVGIDIASDAVRIMKLKHSTSGLIPDLYAEYKYKNPYDFYQEEFDISENEEILSILKRIRKDLGVKYVVSSLPEIKTYIYRTRIMKEALSDIASAIRFGVEDNVPLAVQDVNFDYRVIHGIDNSDRDLEVAVNVFPKKIIQSYTNLLKKADMFCVSFQADSVALTRAVVKRKDQNPYLVIRLLPNRTLVSIIEDGAVQYSSDIPIGSENIKDDLETGSGIDLKESLNKLLIYWFTSRKENETHRKVENVLVTGHLANDQKVINFLEKNLKINVDTGNVWTNCFCLEQYVPKLKNEDALNYAVAIGLALTATEHA